MSADDFIHNRPLADDPYTTRPLRVREIVAQADAPSIDAGETNQRTRTRRPRSGGGWILNILVVLFVVLLVGASGGLYFLDQQYQGKIYPNVTIEGVSVAEMTPNQAEAAIRARHQAFLDKPVTLTLDGRTWQPTAQELGISFDFGAAVDQAYNSGRGHGLVADLREVAAIWQNGLELPLRATFDQRAMHQYLQGIAAELDEAPVDATLTLNTTEATVATTPSTTGKQVLVDETLQDMSTALLTLTPQNVAVRSRELAPRLNDAAVSEAKGRIEALLSGPLTLTASSNEYVWSPKEIALMLDVARVAKDGSTDTIAATLNDYQIRKRLRAITDDTGRGSVNPRLSWNGGNLQIVKPGQPGQRLDEQAAYEQLMAWNGGERALVLPVREVQPDVTEANLNQLGINELISVGRSDFTGSADYRITNIGVGMEKFNGLLLAPGEEFSFNDNVGSIDARNGFVEGYAIIQNRTQLEFGGGICQDSTTIFRAAFWAGLPFTEWHAHSFYINWYDRYALGPNGDGPGMDATIFTGAVDLKFVNDTGNWILIQSFSNPATGLAEVAMYGTKPNRTVQLSHTIRDRKPAIEQPVFIPDASQARGTYKRTDTKRGGMTIDVYRTITENGVQQKPELFQTVFKPWADKYTVNPADIGANGRPMIGPWAPQPVAPPVDPAQQPVPAPEQPAHAPEQQAPAPEQPAPEQPAPEQPAPATQG